VRLILLCRLPIVIIDVVEVGVLVCAGLGWYVLQGLQQCVRDEKFCALFLNCRVWLFLFVYGAGGFVGELIFFEMLWLLF